MVGVLAWERQRSGVGVDGSGWRGVSSPDHDRGSGVGVGSVYGARRFAPFAARRRFAAGPPPPLPAAAAGKP